MGKDAGFRIRVERDLRDEFVDVCRTHDRPAAQVIRDFMRQYIEDNSTAERQTANSERGNARERHQKP
jgi:Ribbon-helix-helix protein